MEIEELRLLVIKHEGILTGHRKTIEGWLIKKSKIVVNTSGEGDYKGIHTGVVDIDVHLTAIETGEESEGGIPGSQHGLNGFAADFDQGYYNGENLSY